MADKDIAPELIDKVNKDFGANIAKDKRVKALNDKLTDGKADYKDAYAYAESVGNARARAFGDQISSDVLPDGKMHYNIASRLLDDSLTTDYDMVSEYAARVQEIYNEKAGIGLKALKPDIDQDRIKGFIEGVCNADVFDDVAWKLAEPVITHARSVVDDTIKKNAEFQGKAGIKATVIRNADSKCCEWCAGLDGDYVYPNVPRKVFQRHDNCKCTVDYNGRKLAVYNSGGRSHSFRDQGEQERIDIRKELTNNNNGGNIKDRKSRNDNKRDNVMLPDGTWTQRTERTRLEQIKIIAGNGRDRDIDIVDVLVSQYPGSQAELWQKKKAFGYIDYQGESYKADLHWYEEPHVGKTPMKVKPDAAGNWFYED